MTFILQSKLSVIITAEIQSFSVVLSFTDPDEAA